MSSAPDSLDPAASRTFRDVLGRFASGVTVATTVVDGLECPHGLLVSGQTLYIVDVGAKTLVAFDLETKSRQTIASNLPVGAPPGVTPKPLLGLVPFSGPQGPFTGIAAGHDGTIYISGDAEGSVLALRKGA